LARSRSKRLRYQVAVSLDGFIAGPHGEYDWIVTDPSIDFAALYREFDTVVMGRKTYEVATAQGGDGRMPGLDVVVFSQTLSSVDKKGLRIVKDDPREVVAALKAKSGRDIWLFGGGALFRTLLDAGLVDSVELAVMPVMLGSGIPVLPPGGLAKLVLADHKLLPATGIVVLSYSVPGPARPAPPISYVNESRRRSAKKGSRPPSTSTARRSSPKRSGGRTGAKRRR
jgi:dihydrofolate reductase